MDLSQLFASYTAFIAGKLAVLDSLALALIQALAVVAVIVAAAQEKFKANPDPGAMILRLVLRIGFTLLLFRNYQGLVMEPFYHGMLEEVAFQLGDLDVLERFWDLVLKMAGFSLGFSIFGNIGSIANPILIVTTLAGFLAYGLVIAIISAMILTAGFYLAVGKLMLCTLIFTKTEALFMAWFRALLGAMFGLAAFWFFMAALGEFSLLDQLLGQLTDISSVGQIPLAVIHFAVVIATSLLLTLQARRIGREMV